MEPLHFYSVTDDWGAFSNFAPYPIRLRGKTWPSTEHYFQAQKFKDRKLQERVRKARSPAVAARMGRDRRNPLRRDWESVKDGVMLDALRAKFTQHDDLADLLLSTGPSARRAHRQRCLLGRRRGRKGQEPARPSARAGPPRAARLTPEGSSARTLTWRDGCER